MTAPGVEKKQVCVRVSQFNCLCLLSAAFTYKPSCSAQNNVGVDVSLLKISGVFDECEFTADDCTCL